MGHTPGESHDSEMSEEEIIEVGFTCYVFAYYYAEVQYANF